MAKRKHEFSDSSIHSGDEGSIEEDSSVSESENDQNSVDASDSKKPSYTQSFTQAIQKLISTTEDSKGILSHASKQLDDQKLEQKAKKVLADQKKNLTRIQVEYEWDPVHERALRKIATKGVVALFNAIKEAQKTVETLNKEGVQKHKAEAPVATKSSFLQALRKQQGELLKEAPLKEVQEPIQQTEASGVAWVQSDFMEQASKAKHWDEEDD